MHKIFIIIYWMHSCILFSVSRECFSVFRFAGRISPISVRCLQFSGKLYSFQNIIYRMHRRFRRQSGEAGFFAKSFPSHILGFLLRLVGVLSNQSPPQYDFPRSGRKSRKRADSLPSSCSFSRNQSRNSHNHFSRLKYKAVRNVRKNI